MKALLFIGLAVLGLSGAAFGQGTIAFNNFSANVGGRVANASTNYRVELMYAAIGSTNFASARVFSNSNNGMQFFDGTTVVLSGIAAGTGNADSNSVQLYLRAWMGPFADWNSALVGGGIGNVAQTLTFLNPTGGAGTALPANLIGWLANNPLVFTPEPSSLSLGTLSFGAMMFSRRKRSACPRR